MKQRLAIMLSLAAFVAAILTTTLFVGTSSAKVVTWPTYKLGSKGENVRTIQYLLRHKKYSVTVDGTYGLTTVNAVKSFQTKNNIKPANGVVDAKTWPKLIVVLKFGQTGPAVTALQRQLKVHGSTIIPAAQNGVFDNATRKAVIVYQQGHHLAPNGIADLATWQSLVSTSVAGPRS